jgi:prepilin-type N-terminal cleavage/methylation domain-containing protein
MLEPMRRAFSLPELLLVLALVSILTGMAVPLLLHSWDRLELEAEVARLVSAHQRARLSAVIKGQVLTLSIDSSAVSIIPRLSTRALWSEPGPLHFGVSLSGPARRFTFSPEGFTIGLSNTSLQLARGSSTRTIIFSRLGRVRVSP